MIFTEKRKKYNKISLRAISEYKGDDGVWYSVSEIHAMIPKNSDGDLLTIASLHNRLNKNGLNNPEVTRPKYTEEERGELSSHGGINSLSKLGALSGESRQYNLRKLKLGTFEKAN